MITLTKVLLIAATAVIGGATASYALQPAGAATNPVERGRYLVATSGCNDCHTPWHLGAKGPEPDMSRLLSGHPANVEMPAAPAGSPEWPTRASATMTAWAGPWGTSFTANLTPDKATGLGAWTKDEFLGALRTGRHQGRGRQILPPMPWPVYGQMTNADLESIFAYLQTIPPIANKVPEPRLPQ